MSTGVKNNIGCRIWQQNQLSLTHHNTIARLLHHSLLETAVNLTRIHFDQNLHCNPPQIIPSSLR